MTRLASLDRVKDRIGTTETTDDDRLTELLVVSSQVVVDLVGAEILREADVTIYPWGSPYTTRTLRLPRYPVESIASIKQAYIETHGDGWDGVDALTEGVDYVVIEPGAGNPRNLGLVRRISADWVQAPNYLQVVGTFGFADPSSVPSGAITPPEDLQEAVVADTIMRWQHRNTGGYGSSELSDSNRELKPHPALVQACKRLRRLSIG